jgi:dTDP-4-dehydrorhamnose 3,5-epimerase
MSSKDFQRGEIDGLLRRPLRKFIDERGWLAETFRFDEIAAEFRPVMGYISLSQPGVARGPHEHREQSDLFVFLGPGNFKFYAWDNRETSPTYWCRQVFFGGEDSPVAVLVPPGVVHAYRNVSNGPAVVHNYPNQLFMGDGRRSPIDEIRHEDDADTVFRLD